jgi:hypothetical protein
MNKEVHDMTRIATLSLAFVVLLSPGVSVGVEQTQDTHVNVGDQIWLQQGHQVADVIQNLAIWNEQLMEGTAGQSLLANITGVSHAASDGAEVGVVQAVEVTGWQGQIVSGPCSWEREDQSLSLFGMLSVGMNAGPGQGHALQQSVLKEDQGAGNFAGTMSSAAAILGLQSADLTGTADIVNGVDTRMTVATLQSQLNM